ncbi:MAG: formyltransferase family protein [Bdellovibrionota bacterium]
MRTLLVTSRVTFVPENYARFVTKLSASPHVAAVLFLENRDLKNLAMGAGFWLSRLAPGIGSHLVLNTLASLDDPRENAARAAGKQVFTAAQINAPETVAILRGFDLVINARTRFIYGKAALEAPRLGCINIHHGLLPEQRGVFCDLWAQAEGRPAGFSIHRMTPKLDDGEILLRREVAVVSARSFVKHALASSEVEAAAMEETLERIALAGRIEGETNHKTAHTFYYRNPTVSQIRSFRSKGFRL